MNCFTVLGIEPTTENKTIKRAYAAKSRECHPEEHPEERNNSYTVSQNRGMLQYRNLNSPNAADKITSQETIIRHEINQLLLAYFGGIYQVNAL